ncbi:MAG: Nif3-like dinuclear metal center hexameric protein [Elusimicrobia bacterium RIFOXYA2_FULL_39_19]|nr:MAG: Nif3-like dinuclear metal center hexameric protein [Elusimicrobia bacterium RIFOXYA2_FULL_39_19]
MKKVKVTEIVKFLNKTLEVSRIKDSSKNGLQVKASNETNRIAFAVDACLDTFKKAKQQDCNMVVVHHGLLWKGSKDSLKWKEKNIAYLKKNRMSLYAAHLPLDKHNKYGNNIKLAELLGLSNIKEFGDYHGIKIGFSGRFKNPTSLYAVAGKIEKTLKTKCITVQGGKNKLKTIAIVSGGGSSALEEAILKKYDCFLIGEAPHYVHNEAKDRGMNLLVAGHYHTETLGVKALAELLAERFGVKTVFIDNPTLF